MFPTVVEYAIPGLHVVPPHFWSSLLQDSRRYVQHRRGSLEHKGDAVNEMLSFWVNVVQQQTQTLTIQHWAHRYIGQNKHETETSDVWLNLKKAGIIRIEYLK